MPTVALPTDSLERPAWLPPDVWPFDTTRVDVDGVAIAVTDVGTGPVLLFYTGIGSFIWRDVILKLSADFRCVVLDPPGIGLSAPVPRSATTLANSARAVAAVIHALDLGNVTLVVHDTGGPPAIAAAARSPDRIRGLVGVNTFGWKPAGPAFRAMLAVMGNGVVRQFDLATGLLARVTSTTFGVGRHLDATSRRAYRAGLARSMGAFHDYLREARFSDGIYDEVTRALIGPFRRLPVLTIFGERNDPLGFQPQWKRVFPNIQQTTIPNGNHFPMCDDPDFVAQTIRSWHHGELPRPMETQR
ncbi:MAG TPA: alpha/beta fold hydrolase [Vicinamibacterales bacterium]|nr:alpha/beta fold hydrolase [Vicinamibacterales bacterium]